MMMHILFKLICKQWDFSGMLSLYKEALPNNLKISAFVIAYTLIYLLQYLELWQLLTVLYFYIYSSKKGIIKSTLSFIACDSCKDYINRL